MTTAHKHAAIWASAPCARILGVPVHVIDLHEVVNQMDQWLQQRNGRRWIAVTGSHGIMEGFKHPDFKQILESADLSVPDGKWAARAAAKRLSLPPKQVRGADLMLAFSALAHQRGYRSYFFGDTEEVLEGLTARLQGQFPGLPLAGAYSPPFRPLSAAENERVIDRVNEAKPDVLWVLLGLPKQEKWIFANRPKLNAPIVVAAGAAAKFVSGSIAPAPKWISAHGFEWLWRLMREPRRCWHRSMVYGPQFAFHTTLELVGVRRYDQRAVTSDK
jgi:N-acetylglucosaminyldiphosphoundecaprenol N-acetyl-beta-D-mannosaminyltransferase